MLKRIQENIFHHNLADRGAKIVIGCSGGPDSVCLLDIFSKFDKKYDFKIIIAHVNYGLRGKDSQKDEKLVRRLAKKYSLPIEIKKIPRSTLGTSRSEEKLRQIRYKFFEKARKKHRADTIAVGHSLNDQAETVMLRILRGSGLRGLGAIRFKSGNVIRPLLNIEKKDILSYLRKNKIAFRIDKTNLGNDFTRNKIRNRLFPYLEKNFNPNIQGVLYKLSRSVADDYDFIKKFSTAWLNGRKILSVNDLKNLHPSIQREAIRIHLEKYLPCFGEIESAHVEEVLKLAKSTKRKRQKMSLKGLKIGRKGDKLVMGK